MKKEVVVHDVRDNWVQFKDKYATKGDLLTNVDTGEKVLIENVKITRPGGAVSYSVNTEVKKGDKFTIGPNIYREEVGDIYFSEPYYKPIPTDTYKVKGFVVNDENESVYREKDLVSFGNYLLSKERQNTIINEENLDKVTDADLSNWKELK